MSHTACCARQSPTVICERWPREMLHLLQQFCVWNIDRLSFECLSDADALNGVEGLLNTHLDPEVGPPFLFFFTRAEMVMHGVQMMTLKIHQKLNWCASLRRANNWTTPQTCVPKATKYLISSGQLDCSICAQEYKSFSFL